MTQHAWLPAGVTIERVDPPPGWIRAYLVWRAGVVEGLVALRKLDRATGRTLRNEWQGWATGLIRELRAASERKYAISYVLYVPPPPRVVLPPHDGVCDEITAAIAALGIAAGAYLALSHIARQIDTMTGRRRAHEPVAVWRELALVRQWCELALTPGARASEEAAAAADRTVDAGAYPTTAVRALRAADSPHRLFRTG